MSTTAVKECDKIIAGSYFLKDSSYLAQLTRAPIGWVSCKLAFSSTSSSSLSLTNAVPITFSRGQNCPTFVLSSPFRGLSHGWM